jgi:potassium-transporting ATPase KdpC subunit
MTRKEETNEKEEVPGYKVKKLSHVRPLIGLAIVSLLICGLFFPLLVTGIAQVTMPFQANGDIAQLNGHSVGSYLIDNGFTLPIFFHARNESNPLTASASGVDPDINIGDAMSQIPRISNSTGIPLTTLAQIVNENEEGVYWLIGSPYVNVLRLNLILINSYPSVYSNYTS